MLGFLFAALALLAPAALPAPVPTTLVNNHLYVDSALNAAGPFHFIGDSGIGNRLDPAPAARNGAAVHGRGRLVGGVPVGRLGLLPSLSFGDITALPRCRVLRGIRE
jgi:hypothetical protein